MDDAVVFGNFWVIGVMGLNKVDVSWLKSVVFELEYLWGAGGILKVRSGLFGLLEGRLDQSEDQGKIGKFFLMGYHRVNWIFYNLGSIV